MCLLYTFCTVLNNAWDANIEVVSVTVSIHDVYTGDGMTPLDEGKMLEAGAHARKRHCAALP
jgi:hypothetical protein